MIKNLRSSEHESNYEELLEIKLLAEIGNLTKPFYQKIEFWNFISTTLIIATTAFLLYNNGVFGIKTKNLKVQSDLLQFRIAKFKQDTASFNEQYLKLQNEIALLNAKRIEDSIKAKTIQDTLRILLTKKEAGSDH